MINLGTLNQVEGYTFAYSGTLELGDRKFIVVAFETSPRSGRKYFEIKLVESKSEMDIVISTFTQKEEIKPKKTVWNDMKIEVPKSKQNKSLSLF
jgi:hypothetical protein